MLPHRYVHPSAVRSRRLPETRIGGSFRNEQQLFGTPASFADASAADSGSVVNGSLGAGDTDLLVYRSRYSGAFEPVRGILALPLTAFATLIPVCRAI